LSFPRRRESSNAAAFLDPRLRGGDRGGLAFILLEALSSRFPVRSKMPRNSCPAAFLIEDSHIKRLIMKCGGQRDEKEDVVFLRFGVRFQGHKGII
jgi:hypothetical protein